jgi:NitT/TauT family transport system substrate-binding protein
MKKKRMAEWPDLLPGACRAGDFYGNPPGSYRPVLCDLSREETYLSEHPDEARAIVRDRLNYHDACMDVVRPENQFSLSLDQSLLVAMNNEARWIINNNLSAEKVIPDFREYISPEELSRVRPEAVNIR